MMQTLQQLRKEVQKDRLHEGNVAWIWIRYVVW